VNKNQIKILFFNVVKGKLSLRE